MTTKKRYIDPDSLIWHTKPPEEPGWYLASASRDTRCWRWWDGECWSRPAFPIQNAEQAGEMAALSEVPLGTMAIVWARLAA